MAGRLIAAVLHRVPRPHRNVQGCQRIVLFTLTASAMSYLLFFTDSQPVERATSVARGAIGGQLIAADGAAPPRFPKPTEAEGSLKRWETHRDPDNVDLRFASEKELHWFAREDRETLRQVFSWVTSPHPHLCKNLTRLGGVQFTDGMDGDKLACLDPPFTLGQPGCLVYSFGINNEWSFDKAARQLDCEVFSFDPSMTTEPDGRRPDGIVFHKLGIGRVNHTNEQGFRILVLDHILAKMGHRRRTLQYLKADAEGGEMDMLIDQLVDNKTMYRVFVLDRVEQMGLEIHFRLHPEHEMPFYREVLEAFQQLNRLGFDLVESKPNELVHSRYLFPGVPKPVSLLYETLLIRKRAPDEGFDAKVRYPCGDEITCDLVDGKFAKMLQVFSKKRVKRHG